MYTPVKISKNNTSGKRGVSYDKDNYRWLARIVIKGHAIILGSYIDKQMAINARVKAENDKPTTLAAHLAKKQYKLDNEESNLKKRIAKLETTLTKLKERLKKCTLA